jgi:D-serine deaminase-like pyridoxal phosphate-dependent protein
MERLRGVAARTRLAVSLDSAEAARALSEGGVKAGVLVEIDAGLGRVGVDAGAPAVELAKLVASLPGLEFDGIAFYPGQYKSADEEEMASMAAGVGERVAATLDGLKEAGLEAKVVSGGSTPTWAHSHRVPGMNEIRPGTYIFNDRNCVGSGSCAWEDCAATIITTVVSTARPGQMIVDGGSKTFSSDRLAHGSEVTFGHLVNDSAARFHRMNEEHGYVAIGDCATRFKVGDRVSWIPNHICVCMNLHEQVYGVRGESVEVVWKVEGRGKLQ